MSNLFRSTFFYEAGRRKNNEDSIFPNPEIENMEGDTDNSLFLVCDGMGGHAKGEIASDIICTQLPLYFKENEVETSDKETLNRAVAFVEEKFDAYITKIPDAAKMGSTMTLVHLHKNGVSLAHIGDSRIYQIRNHKIIFETEDHSQVYALYKAGVIKNKADMRSHPDNNIILKAVMGASIKPVEPTVALLKDVQVDDIFFMCTDGVMEAFDDSELEQVFAESASIDTLAAKIVTKCRELSDDNFSGYLIKLSQDYIDSLSYNPIDYISKPADKKEEALKHSTLSVENTAAPAIIGEKKLLHDLQDAENLSTMDDAPSLENESSIAHDEADKASEISHLNEVEKEKTLSFTKDIKQTEHPEEANKEQKSVDSPTSSLKMNTPDIDVVQPLSHSDDDESRSGNYKNLWRALIVILLTIASLFIYNYISKDAKKPNGNESYKKENQRDNSSRESVGVNEIIESSSSNASGSGRSDTYSNGQKQSSSGAEGNGTSHDGTQVNNGQTATQNTASSTSQITIVDKLKEWKNERKKLMNNNDKLKNQLNALKSNGRGNEKDINDIKNKIEENTKTIEELKKKIESNNK